MKIYQIAAMSENQVIGKDGSIPWHLSEDLRRFKEITIGHPVIMGRNTFESLPKPLFRRLNIVLTSSPIEREHFKIEEESSIISMGNRAEGAICSSIPSALNLCKKNGFNEVYIIGGESVYRQTLSITDEIRLTIVHREIEEGDSFYPDLEKENWDISFIEPHGEFSFVDYVPTRRITKSDSL